MIDYNVGDAWTDNPLGEDPKLVSRYHSAEKATRSGQLRQAESLFRELAGFRDSEARANKCAKEIRVAETKTQYDYLVLSMRTAKNSHEWQELATSFRALNTFADSVQKAGECEVKAEEARITEEREELMRREAIAQREAKKAKLLNEKAEQEKILAENKGLGAMFGEKAKRRKAAQQKLIEIEQELARLKEV